MTKEEIFEMKKMDIRGALNLALIMIDEDQAFDSLRKHTSDLVDMLKGDIEAIDSVKDFLTLQSKIIGDR